MRVVLPGFLASFLGMVAVLAGCLPVTRSKPANDGRLAVTATTSLIGDAVREIGGPHVALTVLMPPGTDPHTYQPGPADADAVAEAQLVLFNGLHLEGKMGDLLARLPRQSRAVTNALDASEVRLADGGGANDPHVWFDVALWLKCVGAVREELAKADPAHAADYAANFERYKRVLQDLHDEVKEKADALPPGRRVLVTSHDAFGYFGRAYHFEVRGLQGVSTDAGIGTKDVDGLATFLAERGVPAVFAESSVPDQGLKKVLDTAAAKSGKPVRLVGGPEALFSDSLGAEGTPVGTYVGMVRHNIDTICRALTQ